MIDSGRVGMALWLLHFFFDRCCDCLIPTLDQIFDYNFGLLKFVLTSVKTWVVHDMRVIPLATIFIVGLGAYSCFYAQPDIVVQNHLYNNDPFCIGPLDDV